MSRSNKYTRRQFITVYRKSKSMLELKQKLDISLPTVYTYLKRFKLKKLPPPSYEPRCPRIKKGRRESGPLLNPVHIAKQYRGTITLQELADKLSIPRPSLRNYLYMLIYHSEKYYLTKKYPAPLHITDIKTINALIKYPSLRKDPIRLVEAIRSLNRAPSVPLHNLREYWEHAFGEALPVDSNFNIKREIRPMKSKDYFNLAMENE